MNTRFTFSAGVIWLAAALIGCGQSMRTSSDGSATPLTETSLSSDKAYLAKASCDQVRPHVQDCTSTDARGRAKGHSQRCVEICHRPPGNPANERTMLLPLSATVAHLHHGSHHHGDMDYLGPCRPQDDDSSDDDSSDDSSSDDDGEVVTPPPTDGGTGGTGGTAGGDNTGTVGGDNTGTVGGGTGTIGGDNPGTVTSTPTIPQWCVPIFAIDANCDGIADATGEPLL